MNIFPYSNFHDLNLDWILQQLKEMREELDALVGGSTPSSTIPQMDGTGSAGTEVAYSRGDHRHPTDTSRASATDLTNEINARTAKDLLQDADIAALDAKVKFSASNPLMDGSPSAGFASEQARADHIHPTDTTRASATDLQTEIHDREVADLGFDNRIGTLETAIQFSTSNPLMDGTANPGSSAMQSRADHIHPTDTSRASATDLALLSARVDGISGLADPYASTPEMDGVGSPGTVDEYARGDHRHPSDTTKLSTSGGTVTGALTIEGMLSPRKQKNHFDIATLGWHRIFRFYNGAPPIPSAVVRFVIVTNHDAYHKSEYHEITLHLDELGNAKFFQEVSATDEASPLVEQIRLTTNGFVEIYYGSGYSAKIGIEVTPFISCSLPGQADCGILMFEEAGDMDTTQVSYSFQSNIAPSYKQVKYVDDTTARNITISSSNYLVQTYGIAGLTSDKVFAITMLTWTSNSGGFTLLPYSSGTSFYVLGAAGTTISGLKCRFWYYE